MKPIPEHLISTVSLIKKAYPDGIQNHEYLAILSILYEHISDRNLADGISLATGKDSSVVYNDILGLSQAKSDISIICVVMDKLKRAGLQAWIDED